MVGLIRRSVAEVALGAPAIAACAARSMARQGKSAARGMFGLPARLLDVLVPAATAQVLQRADLTALVIRYVDLDQVMAQIDVNAVARRIDLDALLAAVDLPEIIRESTGTLASDTVRRARMRGIAADEAVDQVRNRLLHRDVRPP
jgi:hypothetical protein